MTHHMLRMAVFVLLSGTIGCSSKKSDAPILLLATDADFGSYTGEILRTEGFNEFIIHSLSDGRVTASYLMRFDVVILAESKIDLRGQEMLKEFVKKGGNLIAFRPDPVLGELFGITPAGGNIAEGTIAIDTTTEQGKGLTSETIQFHGIADRVAVHHAGILAILYGDPSAGSGGPAVVSNYYGKGHAVAFLYNLPKSIVYTRQGNPLFAGIEMDGIPGLRGMDLFADGWLDTSNSTINQADEQMALLSHCIENITPMAKPLPRFWYFPDTLKCLVTLTNDGEYRSETDFEPQFRDVDSMGAKMSIYILEVNKVSKAWADQWRAKGFEIAGHPDDTKEAGNPGWNNMDNAIKIKKNEIADAYGLPMRTNVNHWFVWCGRDAGGNQDFGAQARLEEKNGIELDVNYAHYDIHSNQRGHFLGPPGTNQGNFTGSGLVMKYADVKGNITNVYQHLNAVYDQEYNESRDPEGFYDCFKGLVDRSLNSEAYSFISVKSHNDEYYFSKNPLLKMLAYANGKGIPVWTESALLDFLKTRDEAAFTNIQWSDNRLSFKLKSSLKNINGLTFLLPARHGSMKINSISVNDQSAQIHCKSIKGYEYALVTVTPGRDYDVSACYR